MSFLDSVLSSIETGKPSPIPPPTPAARRPPAPLTSTSTAKSEVRKPAAESRNIPWRGADINAGTKRKAEEQLGRPKTTSQMPVRPSTSARPVAASTTPKTRLSSTSTAVGVKQAAKSGSSNDASVSSKFAPPAAASKPPPKGSYADLMMKAKALQQKAPTTVGMFKHQSVPKEKLSKTERKRRVMETQTKETDSRLGKKGVAAPSSAGIGGKPGIASPAKRRTPEETTYKGTSRPTQHSTQPEYRGTAGLPSRRGPNNRKEQSRYGRRSRMDEYLGTDEEDEGDYMDDYDDYYSESSDMEAGLNDVENEEAAALEAARREDEEEWRAELAAKKSKLERQRKLTALASKNRR